MFLIKKCKHPKKHSHDQRNTLLALFFCFCCYSWLYLGLCEKQQFLTNLCLVRQNSAQFRTTFMVWPYCAPPPRGFLLTLKFVCTRRPLFYSSTLNLIYLYLIFFTNNVFATSLLAFLAVVCFYWEQKSGKSFWQFVQNST